MARLPGLQKRLSKAEQAELELARERTIARLEQLLMQRNGQDVEGSSGEEPDTEAETTDEPADELAAEPAELGPGAETAVVIAETADEPEPALAEFAEAPADEPEPAEASSEDLGPAAEIGEAPADEPGPGAETAGVVAGTADEPEPEIAEAPADVVVVEPADEPFDESSPLASYADLAVDEPADEPGPVELAVADAGEGPTDEPGSAVAPVEEPADEPADEPARAAAEVAVVDVAPAEPSPAAEGHDAVVDEAASPVDDGPPASTEPEAMPTPVAGPPPAAAPGRKPTRTVPAAAGRATAKPTGRARSGGRRPKTPPVLAACPSCALLLDPSPTASRRCVRCRERIVVRRLPTGVLYLTELAAAALEADRVRMADAARNARARDRWLGLATAVGAPAAQVERLWSAPATEDNLRMARTLYVAAANRAFGAARREHRWMDAASIRRTEATSLYRADGASGSPSPEVLDIYRDAVEAELKSLRESGRDVVLVAGTCCDTCQADEGLVTRISEELKAARLPHADCPNGLCRCRWAAIRAARRPSAAAARPAKDQGTTRGR